MRTVSNNPITSFLLFLWVLFLLVYFTSLILLRYLPSHSSEDVLVPPPSGIKPCIFNNGCGGGMAGGGGLSDNEIFQMQAELAWTNQMDISSSDSITLFVSVGGMVVPDKALTPHTSNRLVTVDRLQDKGDLSGTLKDKFGANYNVFATAHLVATSFDIKLLDLPEQSLYQGSLQWSWIIKPNVIGLQVLAINIDFVWKPVGKGEEIDRQVWENQISVDITQPMFTKEQISLSSSLSGALSTTSLFGAIALAAVTWFFGRLTDKKDKEANSVKKKTDEKQIEDKILQKKKVIPKKQRRRSVFYPSPPSELYREQGKYEEAEPLYKRALAIREEQLGEKHPDTAQSLNNLASLYQAQGKYREAEPLYQRALAIREQQLGEKHPDTAQSLHNLATLYDQQRKYIQAEPLMKRALAIFEQQLGKEHPNTKVVRNYYTSLLKKMRQG